MRWVIDTPQAFQQAVVIGATTESLTLDFKADLDRGPSAQMELGRDVAQFANSRGGCLLIGVAERKDEATGIKPPPRSGQ